MSGSCVLFFCVLGAAICTSIFWIPMILGSCLMPPSLSLDDVNIHEMVVYQNTTDTAYQVRSEFSVNLTARNPNTVTKCFSTFRRLNVSVEYQGQQIVQQEVPLGFELKPKENHTVMLGLRGDGYPLKKKSALLLNLELRNSSGVDFMFNFNIFKSGLMSNDTRKANWFTKRCEVIARTPHNGTFSQANFTDFTGGLAWSLCTKVKRRY